MATSNLTAERLREILNYDPETGIFKYRVDRRNGSKAGEVAGWTAAVSNSHKSRREIEVDQRNYRAHRLAWLYVHGTWPVAVIDHINGDPLDNRIANLRDVSRALNVQNEKKGRKHSRSGLLGAHWDASRMQWCSSIMVDRRLRYIGRFETAEEAHAAYVEAKRRLHEGCTI